MAICELGFPYSDPIADGPVIQSSYTHALAAGVTSESIFDMVRRFRATEAQRTSCAAAQPWHPICYPQSEIRNPKSPIRNCRFPPW